MDATFPHLRMYSCRKEPSICYQELRCPSTCITLQYSQVLYYYYPGEMNTPNNVPCVLLLCHYKLNSIYSAVLRGYWNLDRCIAGSPQGNSSGLRILNFSTYDVLHLVLRTPVQV